MLAVSRIALAYPSGAPSSACRKSSESRRVGPLTARRYHRPERIGVLAVVVPKTEFVDVERQVAGADLVVAAHDPALEERPEAIEVRGMHDAAHVLTLAVVHSLV